MSTEPRFPNHRWSGWPGAFCLYCFQEDPAELELAGIGDGKDTVCPATPKHKLEIDTDMSKTMPRRGRKGTSP